jgi:hypothetical protein
MENKELYPELADYIFNYCGKYFWQNEKTANKHLFALSKSKNGVNVTMYKFFMKEENIYENKEIMDLVSGGFEEFKTKVTKRIFEEYGDKLELNLCPKCNKIARTPWAEQCRFCLHSWRDEKK